MKETDRQPTEEELKEMDLMLEEYYHQIDITDKKLKIITSYSYDEKLDELINDLKNKELDYGNPEDHFFKI